LARYCIQFLLLVIVYHFGTHLGLFVKALYGDVSPLWPPAGLALAMVWFSGWRWLPVILVGELLAAAVLGQSLWVGIVGGIGIIAEVVVAMMLIHFKQIHKGIDSLGQVLRFFGIVCLVSPFASAAVGVAGLMVFDLVPITDSAPVWFTWWLGDAAGLMLITPLIWFWGFKRPSTPDLFINWMSITCLVVAFFIFAYLWFPGQGWMFFFLLLPYVVYSSMRLRMHGASLSLLLMAVLVLGEGWQGGSTDFMLSLKMTFVGTCCLTGYILAVMQDANVHLTEGLDLDRRRLITTLHSISDGVVKIADNGTVMFTNSMAEKILGISESELINQSLDRYLRFNSLDSPGHRIRPIEKFQMLDQHEEMLVLCQYERRGNKPSALEMRVCPLLVEEDNIRHGAVIVLRDVTADIEIKRLLEFQSRHDPLTNLPNRRAMDDKLKRFIAGLAQGDRGALLYIDLDQFKLVNDTCGHEVGDLMLKSLSQELKALVGEERFLARIGGDEFALLLFNSTEGQAKEMANELHRTIADFQFCYEDLVFSLGSSIGLTFFTHEDNSPQAVLTRADIACYKAKEKGRNRISVFHAEDSEMLRYKGELEWISQLKTAITAGSFQLYQQGLFDVDDRGQVIKPFGYEILIRLQQGGKAITPGSFIPIAERFGFMPVIDRWVTETLFRKLSRLPDGTQIYNVNLSGATFNDESFFSDVERWAKTYGTDPSRICFEVTESIALADLKRTREVIQHFAALGYQFALDDFGSGTASYAYLSQLPVNYVKLDGSFVRSIQNDPIAKVVIESLVKIAGLKNMLCIAECVESKAEAKLLLELGINRFQGYLYEHPHPMPKSVLNSKGSA